MKEKMKLIWFVLALAFWLAACDGQINEANKLVDEGNAIVQKNNATSVKAGDMFNDLMGANLVQADDLAEYKAANKAKFDELLTMYDQLEKGGNEAAGKFEQASKLKAGDKFQEYAGLKAQEFKKRAEIDKASGAFLKAFLAEKDVEKADQQIIDFNKKNGDMGKEADGIKAKAEQIVKDNPSVFKN